MLRLIRGGAAVLTLASLSAAAQAGTKAEPLQQVIISFDGAQHLEQWERSRSLGRETGARFTYFLSCVYLLTPETRKTYQAPGMARGRSNVGSGLSRDEVAGRLGEIWAARSEGHEIASHACGHFDGKDWSAADWKSEFDQFSRIVADAWSLNGIDGEPRGWRDFALGEIRGFRAPYLSTSKALYKALRAQGFAYDASGVSRGPVSPGMKGGVVRFSLPLIPEGPRDRRVIAMDYNLYVRHSGGKEEPENSSAFEERAYQAFMASFNRQYLGARTPVQLGFHFTLMNDGAYWKALERFARDVCVKDDVRCISYRDYLSGTASNAASPRPSAGGGT